MTMLSEVVANAVLSALEIGLAGGLVYFLYSVWQDARNVFMR